MAVSGILELLHEWENVRQLRGWRGEASQSAVERSVGGDAFSVSAGEGGFSGKGAVQGGSIPT